jgi:hypothetical protein
MSELKNKINDKLISFEKKKKLQMDAIQGLQASRMKTDEKEMWFAMLPYMDEGQLEKLVDILQRENKEVVEMYLSFLNK